MLLGVLEKEELCVRVDSFYHRALGGFYYGYYPEPSSFQYVHCEITGYFLSMTSRLACNDSGWRVWADAAAAFLMERQTSEGAFPHSVGEAPARSHEWHTFDAGIAAVGLLDYSRYCGSPRARKAAEKALDWMQGAWLADGGFHATWDSVGSRWLDAERKGYWSGSGGSYHGKMLIPFIRAGREVMAGNIASWLLSLQELDGGFRASGNLDRFHSHGCCYALEGLCILGLEAGSEAALRALPLGLEHLAKLAMEYQGIPTWIPGELNFRADAQIQFLRLVRIAGLESRYGNAVEASKRRLTELRYPQLGWLKETPGAEAPMVPSWTLVFQESLSRSSEGDASWLI
ncbi:MAG: hypothetical protein SFY68_02760 [Candidatus Sumerlaeia bacterium]|nr:hypothetical protein [Candidatus Sumerlaeia bacterium]